MKEFVTVAGRNSRNKKIRPICPLHIKMQETAVITVVRVKGETVSESQEAGTCELFVIRVGT